MFYYLRTESTAKILLGLLTEFLLKSSRIFFFFFDKNTFFYNPISYIMCNFFLKGKILNMPSQVPNLTCLDPYSKLPFLTHYSTRPTCPFQASNKDVYLCCVRHLEYHQPLASYQHLDHH